MRVNNLFLVLCLLWSPLLVWSQIEVEIIDGCNNPELKVKIEEKASRFLYEVENAYNENRGLKLNGLVNPSAEMSIEMLWENVHFKPEDQYIGEILLQGSDGGYQIRNLPLIILPQDSKATEDYKEAVINFDKNGNISSVYFSIDNNTYTKIMEKGVQLDDMAKRLEILDYVERFRTSYNQKDMDFLTQVFSDDALIITGSVVKTKPKNTDGKVLALPQVNYKKQSKQEYLTNLARIFKNTNYINVNFDDVMIKRHGINTNIYGVRVTQHWKTNKYSDEGYVFMVWDFTNPDSPQIHVRTWQPKYLDEKKKQLLPEEEIFDLNSIEGI